MFDKKEYFKKYREKNKEYFKEYDIKYRKKNKENIEKKRKEFVRKKKLEDPTYFPKKEWAKNQKPNKKFYTYKRGAKIRNLIFDLTKQQFMLFWQKPCCYCGDKIKTIGLDRIDNNKGYFVNNLISCCKVCNKMKMTLEQEQFINQCKKITNFSNKVQ